MWEGSQPCICYLFASKHELHVGGRVASWLVRSTPARAVRARALARDIVLCSCSCGGVTYNGLASRPGELEILLAASCYRNWVKLRH